MDVANNTTSPERSPEGAGGPSLTEVTLGYQLLTSLLLGTLILCAVSGNACVITAIALERSLQTVANYLIGSLSVTDLMVSMLVLPMAAIYQVLNKWTLGQVTCDIFISLDVQVTCDIFISLDVLCCTSSILHLCAIALDRYWAITDPIDYVNKRTPWRATVLISLTWLIGFFISVPPMLGWRTPEDCSDPDACTISKDHGYSIYSTFGAFYIPLLLMLVLYGRIFKAAHFRIRKTIKKAEKKKIADACLTLSPATLQKKSNREPSKGWHRTVEPKPGTCVNGAVWQGEDRATLKIIKVQRCNSSSKTHLPPPSEACGSPPPPSFERHNEKNTEAKQRMDLSQERKTVKTLGIIMGTFILCWLPFFIVALVLPFCDSKCYMPEWLGAVINWLGYSNSLLNPIIYAYFNKDFQSAFKKIIKCKFCRQASRLLLWDRAVGGPVTLSIRLAPRCSAAPGQPLSSTRRKAGGTGTPPPARPNPSLFHPSDKPRRAGQGSAGAAQGRPGWEDSAAALALPGLARTPLPGTSAPASLPSVILGCCLWSL